MKTCSKCKIEQPHENFHKESASKDGLRSSCKACSKIYCDANRDRRRAASKAYRTANPEKVKAAQKAHYKANIEKINACSKAWNDANADKTKARNRAWNDANPEKSKARFKNWRDKNPERYAELKKINEQKRRALKKGCEGSLSKGLFSKLFILQRGKCPICKAELSNIKPKSPLDHIMPLALGGQNVDSNIQILCRICNSKKHSKDPIEFMQSKGFLL